MLVIVTVKQIQMLFRATVFRAIVAYNNCSFKNLFRTVLPRKAVA